MNILRLFGIGSKAIFEKNTSVSGTVTQVYRCWWLRINTKPVRRYSGDGAVYPHVITFDYQVDDIKYTGKLWIPVRYRVPSRGETIDIFIDPDAPAQYACYAFGPANTL